MKKLILMFISLLFVGCIPAMVSVAADGSHMGRDKKMANFKQNEIGFKFLENKEKIKEARNTFCVEGNRQTFTSMLNLMDAKNENHLHDKDDLIGMNKFSDDLKVILRDEIEKCRLEKKVLDPWS